MDLTVILHELDRNRGYFPRRAVEEALRRREEVQEVLRGFVASPPATKSPEMVEAPPRYPNLVRGTPSAILTGCAKYLSRLPIVGNLGGVVVQALEEPTPALRAVVLLPRQAAHGGVQRD